MDPWDVRARLTDVVAMPPTPFDAEDAVDEAAHARIVRRLVTGGIPTVAVNGEISEFYTLAPAETRRCAELTAEALDGDAALIVGVGFDERTAIDAARHARRIGAQGISVHQHVHPCESDRGWVRYHERIAAAVPDLAVIPYVRDPGISGTAIAELADACPNVLAVQYAVPDVVRFAAVVRDAGLGRIVWIAALAELHAPACAAVGATGFASGLANVAPELSMRMAQALRGTDFEAAMRVWDLVRPFEQMRTANGSTNNVSVIKDALGQLGLCRPEVRPPSTMLSAEDRERVTTILGDWGHTAR